MHAPLSPFSLYPMSALPSMALVLLLSMSIFFMISPSWASRELLHRHADARTGFQVTLKRVDSGRSFTRFELLQRANKRSRTRTEKLSAMTGSGTSIDTPVYVGHGEFLMELSIGTPPLPYYASVDTGSDLIWTQCKPCKKCFRQLTPLFDPNNSSTFSILPCSSNLCHALAISTCNHGRCAYLYQYGDNSYTEGVMGFETLTFARVSVPKVGFGCGLYNIGFDEGAGLVGLGRGPLSLVSQLGEPKFSYCLTSIFSEKSSQLLMGSLANLTGGNAASGSILTTPLIKNPSYPSFYYISLNGITIGGTRLPINMSTFAIKADGSGGMIIDSGTTLTYLEQSAFDLVKQEFSRQMHLTVNDSNVSGLELCFTLPPNTQSIEVPDMTFHFQGADLILPIDNYFVEFENGVGCLTMASTSGVSVFGNLQQQNLLIVYDLVKESLSFVHKQCDQL